MPPFDPYREWLGIAPHERPADHYRLLGLARFEADVALIAQRADERMALVRSFQTGPRGTYTQKLLNELSAAKVCLLSPTRKTAYDTALRQPAPVVKATAPEQQPVSQQSLPPQSYPPQQNYPVYYAPPPTPWSAPAMPQYPAAPPYTPPPPPPPNVPKVVIRAREEPTEELPAEPALPAAWWKPVAALVALSLVVLGSFVVWGIVRTLHRKPLPEEHIAGPEISTEMPIESEPPPKPQVLLQEGDGSVNFSPAVARLEGGVVLQNEGAMEVLVGWAAPDAAAQWQFRLVQPGFFQIELIYATAENVTEAALEVSVKPRKVVCELRATGGLDKFHADNYTIAIPKGGQHSLVLRPIVRGEGDWLIVRSLRLIPVGKEARPPPVATQNE